MGKYNDLAAENKNRSYLPEGKHEVTVGASEIRLGGDARPAWATKSISFRFENEDGIVYWDCELDPLLKNDGTDNDMAVTIGIGNLENMGCEFGEIDSPADFAREAEAFVMNGGPLGAKVMINVIEKISDSINDKTGKPYINRNVYVNELLEAGASSPASVGLEAEVF